MKILIFWNRSWTYNCPTRWYTVVDEMSVWRRVVDAMSVDELSRNHFFMRHCIISLQYTILFRCRTWPQYMITLRHIPTLHCMNTLHYYLILMHHIPSLHCIILHNCMRLHDSKNEMILLFVFFADNNNCIVVFYDRQRFAVDYCGERMSPFRLALRHPHPSGTSHPLLH